MLSIQCSIFLVAAVALSNEVSATAGISSVGASEVQRLSFLRQTNWPSLHIFGRSNVTYSFTAWSDYTGCNKVCGGGTRTRSRSCVDSTGAVHPVIACWIRTQPSLSIMELLQHYIKRNIDTQMESCNIQQCATSEWSTFGGCSMHCGGGRQIFKRSCLNAEDQTMCHFLHTRETPCNTNACYQLNQWSEWSNCSHVCMGGVKHRYRNCIPNLPPSSPAYSQLMYVIDNMGSVPVYGFRLNVQTNSTTMSTYIYQYISTCTQETSDVQYCNQVPCPVCPQNQHFFSCKPCGQQCKRKTNSEVEPYNLIRLLRSFSTCRSGECTPGCGCPVLTPYLGVDGRCYTFEEQCPINQGSRMISNTGIPGFGHNFQSTSPPAIITPANLLGRANTQMTTGAPTPGTIYSTPGTTTSPETTTTTSAETTTTSTSLPACIYDTLIATNPGFIPCECNGNIVEQTCQEIPGTSCPVVCNRINGPLICPALTNVRKSECSSLSTCDRDSMCAIGSLCCTTHCGQQCLRGVEPPSA